MTSSFRSGRFEQSSRLGVLTETPTRWRAVVAGVTGEADTPVGACVAATSDSTSLLLIELVLTESEIEASVKESVAFVAASPIIHNADLLPDEPWSVAEHPGFEEVARIFGPTADSDDDDLEEDCDVEEGGDEAYYTVGRIGHLYFTLDYGPVRWDFAGWYDDALTAAEAVAFSGEGLTVLLYQ